MSTLTLKMFEEAMEKAQKFAIPPEKRVKQIVIYEGNPDPRDPTNWRNRPGLKKLLPEAGLEPDSLGIYLSGIPLVLSRNIPSGWIILINDDGKIAILEEPQA